MTDAPHNGFDIKTMAGLPDNLFLMMGPSQIAAVDTESGASVVLPYEDVHAGFARHLAGTTWFEGQKARPLEGTTPGIEPMYSVTQHMIAVTNLCREIDMTPDNFHDTLEREERLLRSRIARKQEQMMSDAIYGTTTQAEARQPYTLDQLEADLAAALEERFEHDQTLIEALLSAGCDIVQGGSTNDRPIVTLPASMDRARKAVIAKRANRDRQENTYRDTLAFWGGRLDIRA